MVELHRKQWQEGKTSGKRAVASYRIIRLRFKEVY
jgi:hypothetical protein